MSASEIQAKIKSLKADIEASNLKCQKAREAVELNLAREEAAEKYKAREM
jgi:hypothetical protein